MCGGGMPGDHLPELLCDGESIARDLHLARGTLRNWKLRGLITARGRDPAGRTLFSYDQVAAVADAATRKAALHGGRVHTGA